MWVACFFLSLPRSTKVLFTGYPVACEQQTHFRSSLLSLRKIAIFRRERSDDRKCVCCSQASYPAPRFRFTSPLACLSRVYFSRYLPNGELVCRLRSEQKKTRRWRPHLREKGGTEVSLALLKCLSYLILVLASDHWTVKLAHFYASSTSNQWS